MSQWRGNTLALSLEGKSHDSYISGTLTGIPQGIFVDTEALKAFMARRAPGSNAWSTPRKEPDEVEVVSGVDERGITTGAALEVRIANTNIHPHDYEAHNVPRLGHADFAYFAQTGHQIESGGGAFSGRLTAPLCALGFVALSELKKQGIEVGAQITQIHNLECDTAEITPEIEAEIMAAKRMDDSVGGKIRVTVTGLPAGIGGPYFDGLDSALGSAYFGIPAVKAVEFGAGVSVAGMLGSENNDPFVLNDGGRVVTESNNHGGLLGGITSGMPLVATLSFKPTPSIARPQKSVNLDTHEQETLEIHGRHDPCIVPRALPVVEAVTALVMLDALLTYEQR